jgi:hypothetical protein
MNNTMAEVEGKQYNWTDTKWSMDVENEKEFSSCGNNFFHQNNPSVDQEVANDTWVDCTLPQPSIPSFAVTPNDRRYIHGSTNLHYQRAYEEASETSTEHLSNAQWTTLRIRRDRQLQRLQNRKNRQNSEEVAAMRHREEEFIQMFFRNREPNKRGQARRLREEYQNLTLFDREVLLFDEGNVVNDVQQDMIRYRRTARQMPVSAQAQRERLNHRSLSLLANSLRLVIHPWRAFRGSREITPYSNAPMPSWVEQDDDSSSQQETPVDTGEIDPYWNSGNAWTWNQDEQEIEEEDDNTTAYWSSGTAMETNCDSDLSHSSGGYREVVSLSCMIPAEQNSNSSEAMSSLSVEPNQDHASPRNSEDFLFPEDSFAACNF